MANEEHLKLLKKGVTTWNEWRKENFHTRPYLDRADLGHADLRNGNLVNADLSWANLSRADLSRATLLDAYLNGADLSVANLRGANLSGANLSWANLSCANLTGATLSGANLSGATLLDANLSRAILSGANLSWVNLSRGTLLDATLLDANLSWAILSRADLSGADLSGANLSGATLLDANLSRADLKNSLMGYTTLANIDLSTVKELETVLHAGPSTVGIDTIYASKGKISEIFLRGAGVPEPFTVQMKALVGAMEPIQFYSCFINYSNKDEEFAKRLYADLQWEHVRCWHAPEDMKIGGEIRTEIDRAIHVQDKLLIVLSENSLQSAWVKKEVEAAFEKEQKQNRLVLFPIRLDETVMETDTAWAADIRRMRNIGDFRGWKDHDKYINAFARLMRDLKAGDQPAGSKEE
jgi:uncharacterized protein YjbI with pentapeptide repeats